MNEEADLCPICDRIMLRGKSVTRHHLIPKLKGGKETVRLHQICHGKIHATWDENTIRDHYNTVAKIRAAPEMASFIAWVKKKPPEFVDGTHMANGHKRKGQR
jgi:hypothetical protein